MTLPARIIVNIKNCSKAILIFSSLLEVSTQLVAFNFSFFSFFHSECFKLISPNTEEKVVSFPNLLILFNNDFAKSLFKSTISVLRTVIFNFLLLNIFHPDSTTSIDSFLAAANSNKVESMPPPVGPIVTTL